MHPVNSIWNNKSFIICCLILCIGACKKDPIEVPDPVPPSNTSTPNQTPTAPLVEPQDYDRVIQKAIDEDADTVITVYPCAQKHPAIMFTLKQGGKADWFLNNSENRMSRRQELPPIYMRSGLAYVFKTSMILERRTLYGERLYAVEVPEERGMIDINSPFDLKLAEALMQERQKNKTI